jgi:di/tricarboxylate transporter
MQIIPGVLNKNWTISTPGRRFPNGTLITPPVISKDWIHLWPCAVLTATAMLLTGCFSGDQARASIMWDVYLAIAAAFGVSATMERTNVANEFAQVFIRIAKSIGGQGAGLTAICE